MKMYDLEEMISLSKRAAQIVPDCGQKLIEAAIRYNKVNELVVNNILSNYDIEMRDLVGDEMFLLRKKIEKKIYDKYPDKWVPLYSMVTFSHTPYADALAIGKKQEKIMDEIMAKEDIKQVWDSQEVEDQILAQL